MASITIGDIDPRLKERLRVRAARHGRAMEEEVRVMLRLMLAEDPSSARGLGDAVHARFRKAGGVELELPEREAERPPPRFR